ncbi:MAG: hypothetical protein AAB767_02480 [Patescibacteria group bacterium]
MSANENWDLRVDDTVNRHAAKFPKEDVLRIFEAIESLRSNPYAGDIEKLKGEENKWRRRVGVYRIFGLMVFL